MVDSVRVSTNCPGEYRKMGGICVSTEKLWNPGEYREMLDFVRVSKNCPGEYGSEFRKMVQSGRGPRNGRFRASLEKLSWRVRENGRIYVNTEKW